MPDSLLEKDQQDLLADALFSCTRYWSISLHFNKGLSGAPKAEIERAKNTAMNPAVTDAFALAIVAGSDDDANMWPDVQGYEPDAEKSRARKENMDKGMEEIKKLVPQPASYFSESNYFEEDWQQSFWGTNYSRLLAIKKKYDPDGLFYIHHGVGSEEWFDNGFTRTSGLKR